VVAGRLSEDPTIKVLLIEGTNEIMKEIISRSL